MRAPVLSIRGWDVAYFAVGEGFQDPTRNSTAITDRKTMPTCPFAHYRRVQRAAAPALGLRRGRLVGGLRG